MSDRSKTPEELWDEIKKLRTIVRRLSSDMHTLELAFHGLDSRLATRLEQLTPRIVVTRPVEGTPLGSNGDDSS